MTGHDHAAGPITGLLPLLPLFVALVAYLAAAARPRPGRRPWSRWRAASFTAGIGIVAVALAPPMVAWAHADLRAHMAQHLAVGMVAPLALVLGAPVTLVLRSVPVVTARQLTALLRSTPVRLLTHPVTALVLNVGGMYLLYLTPLYRMSLEQPALHWMIHAHVLAAGWLFAWSIVGPDPAPHRPRFSVRLVVLSVAMAAHAYLGKALYAHLLPAGITDAETVRQAARLMYYGGDAAELLLLVALFVAWYRRRGRRAVPPPVTVPAAGV